MMHTLKHRGPDDSGYYLQDQVGLGHTRLSIVDLTSAGQQPFYSHDQRYLVIFNGEIYNHLELKAQLVGKYHFNSTTDTEVLLYAYIEWGEQCLEYFNGMFAFAIFDTQEQTLFAARDRFGIKPFYYYLDEQQFIFASEIPAILSVLDVKPKANYQAIFDFLVFNIPDHNEETFFAQINKLCGGHQLTVAQQQVSIKQWYNIRQQINSPFDNEQQYRQAFSQAVGLRLRSDVPVGVCLSGGIDSSSIASVIINDHNNAALHTFSAVYGKGVSGDESEYIDSFGSQLQNRHFTNPSATTLLADIHAFVAAQAEPVSSTALYAQYKVMQLASKQVTVTLDGQGADEQLAGYLYFFGFYYKTLLKRGRWVRLLKEIKANLHNHRSLFGLKSFVFVMLPSRWQMRLKLKAKGVIHKRFIAKHAAHCQSAKLFFTAGDLKDALIKHFEYKLDHLLKWGDRNSMYSSVESRVPFLDHNLVERTLATDINKLIKDGTTKHILRAAVADILPPKIVNRQDKMGFKTPDDDWFREPQMRQLFIDTLDSPQAKARGIFDHNKMMSLHQQHLNGKINIAAQLWQWLNLELWFREFIDH